jgi:hypothetical protein
MKITYPCIALLTSGAVLAAPAVAAGSTSPTVATSTVATVGQATTMDPVLHADQLVRAWGRGDRIGAAALATPSVVAALFGYSTPGGVSWRRIGGQGAAGTIFVTYHDDARGGTVTLAVSDVLLGQGNEQAAYDVRFSQARPVGPVGYADQLVRAWGRGDHAAVQRYATVPVASALWRHADPGGAHWRRAFAQGAAGTTYVTYHDDAHGGTLTLAVGNAAEQDGQLRAVYDARFGR